VLLVLGTPCQLRSLVGQEHGRTIPLADVSGREDTSQEVASPQPNERERLPVSTVAWMSGTVSLCFASCKVRQEDFAEVDSQFEPLYYASKQIVCNNSNLLDHNSSNIGRCNLTL